MMAISLIVLAVVVALIALIAVGVRLEPREGGEDMIKNVYVYLVLFATLMMTIGGSVAAFMAVADIIAPAPYYQSIEDFRMGKMEQPGQSYSDAEIKARYEAAAAMHREEQIGRAKNNLIKSFGWIVIPLPIFVYFQRRLVKKAETPL